MPTYQANAVVLRRLEYGEADRILTLLTREYGKLGAIAKGARRGKARAGSSLDLFSHSQMMLAKGRNLDVVAQVQRLGDSRHIAGDVARTAYASLVSEVVDKVLEERHPVDEIFDLVVVTLDRLNTLDASGRRLVFDAHPRPARLSAAALHVRRLRPRAAGSRELVLTAARRDPV